MTSVHISCNEQHALTFSRFPHAHIAQTLNNNSTFQILYQYIKVREMVREMTDQWSQKTGKEKRRRGWGENFKRRVVTIQLYSSLLSSVLSLESRAPSATSRCQSQLKVNKILTTQLGILIPMMVIYPTYEE